MPKETFFRLPKEKQGRIFAAARTEFSLHSLKDASVNQIIRGAEIPRGSFYQYFEDIHDLYFYYFSLLRKNEKKNLETAFKNAHGDFFEGIEIYFEMFLTTILDGPDKDFYRHLFTSLDYHSSDRVMPYRGKDMKKENFSKFKPDLMDHLNLENLKVSNEREFTILFKLVMNIFFSSINEAYQQNNKQLDKKEVIQLFQLRLSWLKDGVIKR